jgi:ribosomal protein S18 acetylase RimI-like enzyme
LGAAREIRAPNVALPAAASQRHLAAMGDSLAGERRAGGQADVTDKGLRTGGSGNSGNSGASRSTGAAAPGVMVRPGSPEDAERLSTFAARTFHESFAADNDPADMAAYISTAFTPARQGEELADPSNTCLLAEIGGELAGYALIKSGDDAPECVTIRPSAELSRLYVDRRWHGAGVARLLMDRVLDDARGRGARGLWLGVWEHNVRAVRFYAKHGFADIGSHEFVLGSDVQTDRVMWQAITNANGK